MNFQDEFVDKRREVSRMYNDLLERLKDLPVSTFKKELQKLINRDPDFFDSYLLLAELYFEEGATEARNRLIDQAYQRAIRLITDEKEQWPKRLEWGWLQNRHIIRTLVTKGIQLWESGNNQEALALFRNLLQSNPNDNPGVRFFILAIRMGMRYEDFQRRFEKEGFYDETLCDWFDKNYKNWPDEFDWWDKLFSE